MAAGKTKDGRAVDLISIFEGVAQLNAGKIDEDQLAKLEQTACPGQGSCSGMFTANSMNCLCEGIGMALPGNGTILAIDPKRDELYAAAGRQIMTLIEKDIKPLDIITKKSFDNATNTVLHTLAVANEAEIEYGLGRINEISSKCPNICKVSPSSKWHMEDVDAAGGISAILNEISKVPSLLNTDCLTVTGNTIGENIAEARIKNPEVIHPLDNAYSKRGGLTILTGNLAPKGSVVKTAGVAPGNPLRRPQRRTRNAGNAQPDKLHNGRRPRRIRRPNHRRQIQRRNKRRLHRTHQPRSRSRRTDWIIKGRRHNRNRHPEKRNKRQTHRRQISRKKEDLETAKTKNNKRMPRKIRIISNKRRYRCSVEMVGEMSL